MASMYDCPTCNALLMELSAASDKLFQVSVDVNYSLVNSGFGTNRVDERELAYCEAVRAEMTRIRERLEKHRASDHPGILPKVIVISNSAAIERGRSAPRSSFLPDLL